MARSKQSKNKAQYSFYLDGAARAGKQGSGVAHIRPRSGGAPARYRSDSDHCGRIRNEQRERKKKSNSSCCDGVNLWNGRGEWWLECKLEQKTKLTRKLISAFMVGYPSVEGCSLPMIIVVDLERGQEERKKITQETRLAKRQRKRQREKKEKEKERPPGRWTPGSQKRTLKMFWAAKATSLCWFLSRWV